MKIGIAVTTTPNREHVFQEWYKHYAKICPELFLYIHNDIDYKGIVYSKNKCLNALYEANCTHFFIFDDDCLIMKEIWWAKYTLSLLNHACWNYDRKVIKKQGDWNELQTPNGCMLYCKRIVLDTVGGLDSEFVTYSYDHVNWSDRIYNNGLTPARYIDVANTSDLFKLANCASSVSENVRVLSIPKNYELYQEKFYSKEFKPFK